MTKTQDRQVYLDVAKGMGMLGVVASHCLVAVSYTHLFSRSLIEHYISCGNKYKGEKLVAS